MFLFSLIAPLCPLCSAGTLFASSFTLSMRFSFMSKAQPVFYLLEFSWVMCLAILPWVQEVWPGHFLKQVNLLSVFNLVHLGFPILAYGARFSHFLHLWQVGQAFEAPQEMYLRHPNNCIFPLLWRERWHHTLIQMVLHLILALLLVCHSIWASAF